MLATNVGLTLKALQEILSIFKKMSDMRRLHFGNSPLVSERRLDLESPGDETSDDK